MYFEAASKTFWITFALAIFALLITLQLGLLPALLGGLLVYEVVVFGARRLEKAAAITPFMAKCILLILLATVILAGLTLSMGLLASRFTDGPESLVELLQRMADVVSRGRTYLPLWTQQYLPDNIHEWQVIASDWLRENARHLSIIGRDVGEFLIHLIVGMIIGGIIAINADTDEGSRPLSRALCERAGFVGNAFRRIVFSQIRISALNTFLTAIFLVIVLPLSGIPLPLTKTMVAVTFFAGLLPIVGNLISNTVIVLISLSVSPIAAVVSLVFLVVIHKLEYFVNARIIGGQIHAKAWEILLAMLVMEAAFGLAGLIAAPIYYAYLKDELSAKKLI